jgi:tight adherence protein B
VLIAALTFVLVLGIVLGMYWAFVVRAEQATDSALRKRMDTARAGGKSIYVGVQREVQRLSSVPALNRLLSSRTKITVPIQRLIEQSGVKATVGVVVLSSACFGALGVLVGQTWTGSVALGLLLGVFAGAGPTGYLRWKVSQRLKKFEELFPEALALMTRAMRAGHTFITALGMVATELPQPIAGEFKLLHDRQNFGLPIAEALRDFGERIPILSAKFFVTAVLTQRESGGNLAEVLENLASVIRERFTIMRQVRVKSAHGRMSGWILTGLPPVAALVLSILNPGHFGRMLNDPFGIQLIVVAVILQVVGALIIRKIVNVEY